LDFPASSPIRYSDDTAGRTWPRAAIVTAAIAALELVALLVIALAFIAKPFTDEGGSAKQGKAAAAAAAAAAAVPRAETPVIVMNGNGIAGAAGAEAKRVRKLDYPIVAVTDASRRDFGRTLVMYRAGSEPAAVRLARDLGLPPRRAVVPLDGMRTKDLLGAELALIVGS
jgi:LytR cell envelope-related transcriptional attenuator